MSHQIVAAASVERCLADFLAAKIPSTRRAYLSDYAVFTVWSGAGTFARALHKLASAGPTGAQRIARDFYATRKPLDAGPTARRRLAALQAAVAALKVGRLIDWKLHLPLGLQRKLVDRGQTTRKALQGLVEQVRRFHTMLARDDSLAGIRDRAIIGLIESPMLGLAEVAGLTRADVDIGRSSVSAARRSRRSRQYLPMPTTTCGYLREWLDAAPHPRTGPLFRRVYPRRRNYADGRPVRPRRQWTGKSRLSTSAISEMVFQRSLAAGLRLRPRHIQKVGTAVFLAEALKGGVPLEDVIAVTRHSKVEAIWEYLGLQNGSVAAALDRAGAATHTGEDGRQV